MRRHLRNSLPVAVLAGALALAANLTAPVAASPSASPARPGPDAAVRDAALTPGSLVSVTPLQGLSRTEATRSLRRGGWGEPRLTHGVRAFRITYVTTDVSGNATNATGLLAIPRGAEGVLPTVMYMHGTTTYRRDVASGWHDPYVTAPAVLVAGKGMAAVLPDYLGLGSSTLPHPWMHVATETSASLDMLTAAREAAVALNHPLDTKTDVIGFSQGASVALATIRAIEDGQVQHASSGRTFAISGAYDLRGSELPALVRGTKVHPLSAVAYAALLLVAWNRIWPLYDEPSEVFRRPYDSRVENLFSGSVRGPRMMARLPDRVTDLLTPAGLRLLDRPSVALAPGLRQADSVCRWTPISKVVLMFAADDEQAVATNTAACERRLSRRGASPDTWDLGHPAVFGSVHIGTNVVGTKAAVRRLAR